MNRGIYATAAAMLGAQRQLDVTASNLANVSTTGYKRDEMAFGDTLAVLMRQNGGSGAPLGTMSMSSPGESQYVAFDAGSLQETGSPYDFAIEGDKGLFAVQTPQGVRYTRNGSFELSGDGVLMTHDKYPVLDDSGNPIQIPLGDMSVEPNGTINVDGTSVGKLALYDGAFVKAGDNLYTAQAAQPLDAYSVRWRSIESSNVNAVDSMVDMIQLQRRFDLAQRTIQQQDELSQRLIQSLSQA